MPSKSPCWCILTQHAVEQFISRWAPEKGAEEAARELLSLLNTSTANGKTTHGDQIYISGHRPNIRMVVKDRNVCVTVLPAGKLDDALSLYEEEMAIRAQLAEERQAELEGEIAMLEAERDEWEEKKKAIVKEKEKICQRIDNLKSQLKNGM